MWQWARSRTKTSGWTDIVDEDEDDPEFGKTAIYMPVNDDVGYYLRATVTYKDGESAADVQENDKTAQAVSTNPVRKTPYENAAPVFQDDEGGDTRRRGRREKRGGELKGGYSRGRPSRGHGPGRWSTRTC